MALPKTDTVSTSVPTQAAYEPDAQEMRSLAEKTSPEDRSVLLAALDVLERSDTDVSEQVPSNWNEVFQLIPPERYDGIMSCISAIRNTPIQHCDASSNTLPENSFGTLSGQMRFDSISTPPSQSRTSLPQTSRAIRTAVHASRVQQVAQFRNEPGLERLLSYFFPQSFGSYRLGSFKLPNHDLLTKVVPDILKVLESSTDISDDEKESLCEHSPKAIVGDPSLLRQVLQAAYDISLVSLVARGIEEPHIPLPTLQDIPTLEEKARSTREWLEANGPSIEEIRFTEDRCVTCLPEEICALTSLSHILIVDQPLRAIPHSIGNLCSLRELNLGHNQLTSLSPKIGKLKSLQELYLGYNLLTDLPYEIGNVTTPLPEGRGF